MNPDPATPAPSAPSTPLVAPAAPPAIGPDAILQTAFSFWSAKVLLTAVSLGLFEALADRRATGDDLGRELGLHPRGTADFLDALVAMGFLQRDGDGPDARYANTPATATFLDPRSPHSIAGVLAMLDDRLYRFWGDLGEALRTGRPQNESKNGGDPFAAIYAEPRRLEQFLGAMAGISRGNFAALAARFDFANVRTLCDVGGATGLLCVEVARRHPHLQCTTFDLPAVQPFAEREIAAAGLQDRVRAVAGDYLRDPLPRADVLAMSLVLHDCDLEQKLRLIRSAHDALPPGGALIAIDALIDDARRTNVFGLLMSLNMLVELGAAFDYSAADFRGWCEPIGFRRVATLPLVGPYAAAIAWK